MATGVSIQTLASRLSEHLRESYEGASGHALGTQPLRVAFGTFGRSAALSGVPLEDAMAGGVDALQSLFERVGGNTTDPATMIAAGIALAALARSYDDAHRSSSVDNNTPD